jgi:DNA-binding HxlR family transcriptional regulator
LNDELRRGVPKMSPTLLSGRLKELEAAGVIERREIQSDKGIFEYRMTESGQDLGAVVEAVGFGDKSGSRRGFRLRTSIHRC